MQLSTAQKVRLWCMLAALILGLSVLIIAVQSDQGSVIDIDVMMSQSDWDTVASCTLLGVLCFLTLAVLGPITLYRFLRPKQRRVRAAQAAYYGPSAGPDQTA